MPAHPPGRPLARRPYPLMAAAVSLVVRQSLGLMLRVIGAAAAGADCALLPLHLPFLFPKKRGAALAKARTTPRTAGLAAALSL